MELEFQELNSSNVMLTTESTTTDLSAESSNQMIRTSAGLVLINLRKIEEITLVTPEITWKSGYAVENFTFSVVYSGRENTINIVFKTKNTAVKKRRKLMKRWKNFLGVAGSI